MILGKFEYIRDYAELLPGLEEALQASSDADTLPIGVYPLANGRFMIQEGETKPMAEGTYEAHRKFIDVQVILEGSEEIAWHDLEGLESVIPYNEERDVERYTGERNCHMEITAGMFWAAFPKDAHQAIAHTETQRKYRKLVIKLPVKGD